MSGKFTCLFYRYTCTVYKTSAQIAKEFKIPPILDKLLEYKRSWIQHVNRMPRNRLPRVMKHYCPTGRRNHGRLLKRLLGYVRPERVNKWPNCVTDIWWWWWLWWWFYRFLTMSSNLLLLTSFCFCTVIECCLSVCLSVCIPLTLHGKLKL